MNGWWVETASGKRFSLSEPRPEDVCIEDIAHGLALICRYTGQCDRFYSVAEHSVLCACLAKWDGESADVRMACLLHDAAEAYIGDINGQVKKEMRDRGVRELDFLEDAVIFTVLQGLGLERLYPVPDVASSIDKTLFLVEEREMMPSRGDWLPADWPQPPSERDWMPLLLDEQIGMDRQKAEAAFLRHYQDIRMDMCL